MTGPEGNSQCILFPENLNVSQDEVERNTEIRGKQNSLFPKGPVITHLLYSKANGSNRWKTNNHIIDK